jgi:hypothetical protein
LLFDNGACGRHHWRITSEIKRPILPHMRSIKESAERKRGVLID